MQSHQYSRSVQAICNGNVPRVRGFTRGSQIIVALLLLGVVAMGVGSWTGSSREAASVGVAPPGPIVVTPTEYFPAQYVNQGTDTPTREETH